jgi:hypothetical protein
MSDSYITQINVCGFSSPVGVKIGKNSNWQKLETDYD